MAESVEVTYEAAVRWLHARMGQQVVISMGFEPGVASVITYGALSFGIDPTWYLDEPAFSAEHGDLLTFSVGVRLAGSMFSLSERRFRKAWLRDTEYGETLYVVQGPALLFIRLQVKGDPGWTPTADIEE